LMELFTASLPKENSDDDSYLKIEEGSSS